MESLADHELNNWARWCRSGPETGPMEPDHCGLQYLQEKPTEAENDPNKAPIHIERAKVVQRIFDLSIKVERKVLQAEYVSPWQYARYSSGIHAAVRRINAIDPDTRLSVAGYETILASVKRRVERAFR